MSKDAKAAAAIDEWKSTLDKGLLLYRDSIDVRCYFNQKDDTFEEQKSMVSFYLKDENVMIEVFLYHEAKQMSITSTVSAIELFGRDPTEIDFSERIKHLS